MKMADQYIPELERDELGKGVRGKYLTRFVLGSNVVVLQPEIQKAFSTSEAVSRALASMLAFAHESQGLTGRGSRKPEAGNRKPRKRESALPHNFNVKLVKGKPWDKTPPAPPWSDEVVAKTAAKYREPSTWLPA